eukprot:944980-Rhodomonas_salina.2
MTDQDVSDGVHALGQQEVVLQVERVQLPQLFPAHVAQHPRALELDEVAAEPERRELRAVREHAREQSEALRAHAGSAEVEVVENRSVVGDDGSERGRRFGVDVDAAREVERREARVGVQRLHDASAVLEVGDVAQVQVRQRGEIFQRVRQVVVELFLASAQLQSREVGAHCEVPDAVSDIVVLQIQVCQRCVFLEKRYQLSYALSPELLASETERVQSCAAPEDFRKQLPMVRSDPLTQITTLDGIEIEMH